MKDDFPIEQTHQLVERDPRVDGPLPYERQIAIRLDALRMDITSTRHVLRVSFDTGDLEPDEQRHLDDAMAALAKATIHLARLSTHLKEAR